MDIKNANIARILLGLACVIFLAETVFGCIAILGIGFSTFQDILLDLSLTMAFPIFLITIVSRRIATFCLWIFFVAQWSEMCLISHPPTLISPLDGVHSVALLLGIVLFTFADISLHHMKPRLSVAELENTTTTRDPQL
jgi:hypothetical protein